MKEERAVLAGGCFWGMQDSFAATTALFRHASVTQAVTCRMRRIVITEPMPKHLRLSLIPAKISYRQLLEFFFQIHDPTTRNRQGNDTGTQLSIGDLLHERRTKADRRRHDRRCRCFGTLAGRGGNGGFRGRSALEAEPEHQDYLEEVPSGYTCHFVRPVKLPARRTPIESSRAPHRGE